MIDKDVRAVFIGAIVSMLLSTIALRNHPSSCTVEVKHGQVTQVYIGRSDD